MIARVAPEPDYTQHEIDNATDVLSSMTGDLLACYKQRLRVNPKAHGYITVDILVASDGRVHKVDTTGGAILGRPDHGVHRSSDPAGGVRPAPWRREHPRTDALQPGGRRRRRPDLTMLLVSDRMTAPAVTSSIDDAIDDVARVFQRESISATPVLSGERLAGVVSTTDVIRFLSQ